MSFELNDIVPWGRSFDEYVAMFALSDGDLRKRILGCGDGPASFNAVLSARGGAVVSVDPIYRLTKDEIRRRVDETSPQVIEQTRRNQDEFVWSTIGSVEELARLRMAAMEEFLGDYTLGSSQGRYLAADLPKLPFRESEFDLALCSHLLFLYSEQLSLDFHIESIKELCRVATEARVFPILELGAEKSRHLEDVATRLGAEGYAVNAIHVPYEFQRGGNQMLRIQQTARRQKS